MIVIDLSVNPQALERAVQRARERNIIIPTLKQQRDPGLIPDAIISKLTIPGVTAYVKLQSSCSFLVQQKSENTGMPLEQIYVFILTLFNLLIFILWLNFFFFFTLKFISSYFLCLRIIEIILIWLLLLLHLLSILILLVILFLLVLIHLISFIKLVIILMIVLIILMVLLIIIIIIWLIIFLFLI